MIASAAEPTPAWLPQPFSVTSTGVLSPTALVDVGGGGVVLALTHTNGSLAATVASLGPGQASVPVTVTPLQSPMTGVNVSAPGTIIAFLRGGNSRLLWAAGVQLVRVAPSQATAAATMGPIVVADAGVTTALCFAQSYSDVVANATAVLASVVWSSLAANGTAVALATDAQGSAVGCLDAAGMVFGAGWHNVTRVL